jgi:hypothetical protein
LIAVKIFVLEAVTSFPSVNNVKPNPIVSYPKNAHHQNKREALLIVFSHSKNQISIKLAAKKMTLAYRVRSSITIKKMQNPISTITHNNEVFEMLSLSNMNDDD